MKQKLLKTEQRGRYQKRKERKQNERQRLCKYGKFDGSKKSKDKQRRKRKSEERYYGLSRTQSLKETQHRERHHRGFEGKKYPQQTVVVSFLLRVFLYTSE